MKHFLIIILFFIALEGTKQKEKKINSFKKNYKFFFTKIYSSNKIKASAISVFVITAILFYLKKKKIISIKKTIAGMVGSSFPLQYFLYKVFGKILKEKEENQTPIKKKIIRKNQTPNKKSKIPQYFSYHSEPEKNFKETSKEEEILFLSDFYSDNESESNFIDQTFFKKNQTFLPDQEEQESEPEKKIKTSFLFAQKNKKKISNDPEEKVDKKAIYKKRTDDSEKTFESFLSKIKEQQIQIEQIETFPEKIKTIINNFLDLLEKQKKVEHLSIIKQSKERSDKTIIGNIITNVKKFLFQEGLINDINIFNNILLEQFLNIKKTKHNNNEIFICSRSSINGKEKFEIIFSVNKTNSLNYIAILKITNSTKNNDLFESKQGYFYSGNNVFFENLTLHSIESFIVNERDKQQSKIFLKELFLIKESHTEFLRDIIALKFEEEKNKYTSFLDKRFLKLNLNSMNKKNKTYFWLGIPFNIEEKKANYI